MNDFHTLKNNTEPSSLNLFNFMEWNLLGNGIQGGMNIKQDYCQHA